MPLFPGLLPRVKPCKPVAMDESNACSCVRPTSPSHPVPVPPPKGMVLADRARPTPTSLFPSRVCAQLQALAAHSAPEGGPRTDRSSDARTSSVTGGRTSARRTITSPQVEHAMPVTPNTRHNSTRHGVQRELPLRAFVNRRPPARPAAPAGGAAPPGVTVGTTPARRFRALGSPAVVA